MTRRISPLFATLVILFALIVGALYFMHQYRMDAYHFELEKQGLMRRAQEAMASGRMAEREDAVRAGHQRMAAAKAKPSHTPGAPGAGGKAAAPALPSKPAGK